VKRKFSLDHDSLALFSGLLQGLAVIPGLSRSGSTIFGLSLGKLKPEEILKYSYLMSVPVVAAAALLIVFENPAILSGWPALVSSFIVGYLTLDILMKFADKINFSFFTFLFGLLCILGWVVGLFV
jgi:undecaprenyl-diphosphatase